MPITDLPVISPRLQEGLAFMCEVHAHHTRKLGGVPYASHLLQVAGMAMECGCDEDVAIAALLHDAKEDVGVEIQTIRDRFGDRVADVVDALSEDKGLPKAERKAQYVEQVRKADVWVILISFLDKLHSLRDYMGPGRSLWKDETAAFYKLLMPIYQECDRIPAHLKQEMVNLVKCLEQPMVLIPVQEYERLKALAEKGMDWGSEFPE